MSVSDCVRRRHRGMIALQGMAGGLDDLPPDAIVAEI
jgi:hypothetical protein